MHLTAHSLLTLLFAGLLALGVSQTVAAQQSEPNGSSAPNKKKETEKRIEDFLKSLMLSPLKKPIQKQSGDPSTATVPRKAKTPQQTTAKTNPPAAQAPVGQASAAQAPSSTLTGLPSLLPPLDSMSLGSQLGARKVCVKCGQPTSGKTCSGGTCKPGAKGASGGSGGSTSGSKGSGGSSSQTLQAQSAGKNGIGTLPQQGSGGQSIPGMPLNNNSNTSGSKSGSTQSTSNRSSNGPDASQNTKPLASGPRANMQGKNQSNQAQPNNPLLNGLQQGNPGTRSNTQTASGSRQFGIDPSILPQGLAGLPTSGSQLSDLLNTPIPINDPNIRGMLDTASGMLVPPSWEIIRPAGVGAADLPTSVGMVDSKVSGTSGDQEARVLDGGTIKMAMQTGPKNPLILPPDIASVVYVIDCSGSMKGGKFQRVSAALVDAVQQMKPDQKFCVICFNTLAIRAKGIDYRDATAEAASHLSNELNSIMPVGGTDPTDALLIALQLRPETIVILSDGEFEEQVIERVSHLNRSSGLNCQINCIAIGTHAGTLKRLATLNGPGNYVETN